MSAISELIDVVQHLVETHPRWNMSLSRDEAVAKLAAARSEAIAESLAGATGDTNSMVQHPTLDAFEKVAADLAALRDVVENKSDGEKK